MLRIFQNLWDGKKSYNFYLCGPMRGYKDLNKPMFNLVACMLRERGFTLWSPSEQESYLKLSFAKVIALDLNMVINNCNKIALLPGWRKSLGANGEVFSAFLCGKEAVEVIFDVDKTDFDLVSLDLSKYCLPYNNGEICSFDPHQCDFSSFVPKCDND